MPKQRSQTPAVTGDIAEVTRHIKSDVTAMLWGRAAGRCEFRGCNTPLWKSLVTQETVNRAQRAHIYAFSSQGTRGNAGISQKTLNDFNNLMLVCHGCHQKIDAPRNVGRYTAELLQNWKREHESRVNRVTGISPSKKSHVVLYGRAIDGQPVNVLFDEAAEAMFPRRYPAEDFPIRMGFDNSIDRDNDPTQYYQVEGRHLLGLYDRDVRRLIRDNRSEHVSIFALAPQPLLILLGTEMNDIASADVYQRHREPSPTWAWKKSSKSINYIVERPKRFHKTAALILAMSDFVNEDRITSVLGKEVSIWKLTVAKPSVNLIQTRRHLSDYRVAAYDLLGEIAKHHSLSTTLHIFPVMGNAMSVELGRMRMPKAAMPWQLYDNINGRGFVPALSIPYE